MRGYDTATPSGTFMSRSSFVRFAAAAALAALLSVSAEQAQAQVPVDTLPRDILVPDTLPTVEPARRDTLGALFGFHQRRSRLVFASGKTYNRVEGMPVHIGPVFSVSNGRTRLNAEVFGIIRSADSFRSDSRNLGHLISVGAHTVAPSGAGVRLAAYDVVTAVEEWQMPRGEAGIAAFFLHRDYRDHFGRHGGSLTGSLHPNSSTTLEASFARERWSSLEVQDVFTILRNNRQWRPNPTLDDGVARLLTLRWGVDTRNDVRLPSTGWLTQVEYEYGDATFDRLGPTSPFTRAFAPSGESQYGRALLDLRRYNRISPESQLNLRVVAGGWLHGDELPLQRRFSVGGPATIPGVRFRESSAHPDVYTCSHDFAPPGSPAQCERVLLLQAEYRDELPLRPGTIFSGTPIRIRSTALTLRPVLVAFVDAGRGWLVQRSADPPWPITGPVDFGTGSAGDVAANDVVPAPPQGMIYRRGQIPPLSTFSSDFGVGIDLGLLGAYVAVSLTESGAPVNFILRARSRF
jgi:hypothetical protein